MKKILLTLILIILPICSLYQPNKVMADDSGETYYVGSEILNVRATGDPNGQVIGQLKVGDEITVYKEQYGWAEIKYDGEKAYVASHLITKTPPLNISESTNKQISTVMKLENELPYISRYQMKNTNKSSKTEQDKLLQKQFDKRFSAKLMNWLQPNTLKQKRPLEGYSVIIDAGHGGFDPGSTAANGDFEKELTLTISLAVRDYLESQGVSVTMTRTSDEFVTLDNRALLSTIIPTDAFISIHFNAFETEGAFGISSHYTEDEESKELATYIQSALAKYTQLRDRGVSDDNYYVLKENKKPAVLLELGYITSSTDLQAITSDSFPIAVAKAIEQGLYRFFDIQLIAIH